MTYKFYNRLQLGMYNSQFGFFLKNHRVRGNSWTITNFRDLRKPIFGLLLWNCSLGVLSLICYWICKVLKHRKSKTCLPIKIDYIYFGLVIVSLVPHSPYNPSPRHIKSKLMCRHVNSYSSHQPKILHIFLHRPGNICSSTQKSAKTT